MKKQNIIAFSLLVISLNTMANEASYTAANLKAQQLAKKDLTNKTLLCYSHTERKTFATEVSGNAATLPVTYKNENYQFKISEDSADSGSLTVTKNGAIFSTKKVDLTAFDILGGNATLKDLPNLFCFYGRSHYFFDLAPFKQLAIGVHVLRSFNNDLNWFDKYTEYFKSLSMPVLISRQIGSGKNGVQTRFEIPFLESMPDVLADITQFESYVKTAPTGNQLFYTSTGALPDSIILSGSYFNYCMSKTLYSLARALSATNEKELSITIDSEYSFSQKSGIVRQLNMSAYASVASFIKNSPAEFSKILVNQKTFIEFNIFNGAELSYPDNGIIGSKTANPQMMIHFR
jgi:hypothetical protein